MTDTPSAKPNESASKAPTTQAPTEGKSSKVSAQVIEKSEYRVLSSLLHDGIQYVIGSTVELTDKQATNLIALSVVAKINPWYVWHIRHYSYFSSCNSGSETSSCCNHLHGKTSNLYR